MLTTSITNYTHIPYTPCAHFLFHDLQIFFLRPKSPNL